MAVHAIPYILASCSLIFVHYLFFWHPMGMQFSRRRKKRSEIEAEKKRDYYMNCRIQKWSNPGLIDSHNGMECVS